LKASRAARSVSLPFVGSEEEAEMVEISRRRKMGMQAYMDGEAIEVGCLLVQFTAGVVVNLYGFSAEQVH
jgi:hypothetical protein